MTTRTRNFREAAGGQQISPDGRSAQKPVPTSGNTYTGKQLDFIYTLLEELGGDVKSKGHTKLEELLEDQRFTRDLASGWISRLLELKKEAPRTNRAPGGIETDVPAGHYAVTGEDGTTDFYRVDRPTKGRWEGYTFVKLQLSDDYQNLSRKTAETILSKIAEAGPREAAIRYGHELGRCSLCNRTLTNPESIELGIGPVCADKVGW